MRGDTSFGYDVWIYYQDSAVVVFNSGKFEWLDLTENSNLPRMNNDAFGIINDLRTLNSGTSVRRVLGQQQFQERNRRKGTAHKLELSY
jgi:hypothetical protein